MGRGQIMTSYNGAIVRSRRFVNIVAPHRKPGVAGKRMPVYGIPVAGPVADYGNTVGEKKQKQRGLAEERAPYREENRAPAFCLPGQTFVPHRWNAGSVPLEHIGPILWRVLTGASRRRRTVEHQARRLRRPDFVEAPALSPN